MRAAVFLAFCLTPTTTFATATQPDVTLLYYRSKSMFAVAAEVIEVSTKPAVRLNDQDYSPGGLRVKEVFYGRADETPPVFTVHIIQPEGESRLTAGKPVDQIFFLQAAYIYLG